jgi:2-hydroxychromene-2-carboxylate isomerase
MPHLGRQDLKDALRANVDELIARGGFGVPTFFLDQSDIYFGVDRLFMVREAVRRARLDQDDLDGIV